MNHSFAAPRPGMMPSSPCSLGLTEEIHLETEAEAEHVGLDRRDSERYPTHWESAVRFIVKPGFQTRRASVRELSRTGIGLIRDRPLKPGTILAIGLPSVNDQVSCIVIAEVRHATQYADDNWVMGCRFTRRLAEDELSGLLQRWQ